MHVVGRRDAHGVDLLVHLKEHLPKILIAFRIREFLEEALHVGARVIDIAQRDDFLVLMRHDVGVALAAAADLRDADLGAGGDGARLARSLDEALAAGEGQERGHGGGECDEVATVHLGM